MVIWAFFHGSGKLNEKWDLDNRYAYERKRKRDHSLR